MRVHIRPNQRIHEEECWICGNRFTTPVAVAYACDENECEYGSVCPECLEEGAEAIRERFEAHVRDVKREAMRLEGVAEVVRSETITVPTLEAYKDLCRHCTYEPHDEVERHGARACAGPRVQ
ncbi:MAG: hypothetical protein ACYC35_13405 [Pirellulales bacterium]